MSKTLEAVTFCKKNGERVSIPKLFMEVKEASDHELTFDVQNYEVGHEHLWDVLKEFDGKGRKGRIELEYTDHDKHLYPCAAYQLNVLQDSASIEGKDFRMALGRIELKLGKEVH